jgi:hypothetical protein
MAHIYITVLCRCVKRCDKAEYLSKKKCDKKKKYRRNGYRIIPGEKCDEK